MYLNSNREAPVNRRGGQSSYLLLGKAQLGSERLAITWVDCPVGSEQPMHRHPDAEQAYASAGTARLAEVARTLDCLSGIQRLGYSAAPATLRSKIARACPAHSQMPKRMTVVRSTLRPCRSRRGCSPGHVARRPRHLNRELVEYQSEIDRLVA